VSDEQRALSNHFAARSMLAAHRSRLKALSDTPQQSI